MIVYCHMKATYVTLKFYMKILLQKRFGFRQRTEHGQKTICTFYDQTINETGFLTFNKN